jgi:hypothetical protein
LLYPMSYRRKVLLHPQEAEIAVYRVQKANPSAFEVAILMCVHGRLLPLAPLHGAIHRCCLTLGASLRNIKTPHMGLTSPGVCSYSD